MQDQQLFAAHTRGEFRDEVKVDRKRMGKVLREARRGAGMDIPHFARFSRYSEQSVTQTERGGRAIEPELVESYATLCGVTPRELYGRAG